MKTDAVQIMGGVCFHSTYSKSDCHYLLNHVFYLTFYPV